MKKWLSLVAVMAACFLLFSGIACAEMAETTDMAPGAFMLEKETASLFFLEIGGDHACSIYNGFSSAWPPEGKYALEGGGLTLTMEDGGLFVFDLVAEGLAFRKEASNLTAELENWFGMLEDGDLFAPIIE